MLCYYGHIHPFYRRQVSYEVIKSRGNCKTCLTNRTRPISHLITSLVINALRGGHTDTHTHIPMCKPKQFQETRCARPLAVQAWFKNSDALWCLLCNGGLKLSGIPSKKVGGNQHYKIMHYKDFNYLVGKNWHVRGIKWSWICGSWYSLFYLWRNRPLVDYICSLQNGPTACTIDTGYSSFTHALILARSSSMLSNSSLFMILISEKIIS